MKQFPGIIEKIHIVIKYVLEIIENRPLPLRASPETSIKNGLKNNMTINGGTRMVLRHLTIGFLKTKKMQRFFCKNL